MDRTLVICKPDAVERGLAGQIVARLEAKGLRLAAAELRTIDAETAGTHYGEHKGKPFYDDLVRFITRGPALLMVVEGPEGTRLVELTSDRSSLGRATTNDVVVLLDPTVSRIHAVIERYPTGFCVRDRGSTNGTFVNGEPVKGETRLRTGDELRLGNSRLTFFTVNDSDSDITAVADGPPILTRREREVLLGAVPPAARGSALRPPAGSADGGRAVRVGAGQVHLANLYDNSASPRTRSAAPPPGHPGSEAIRRRPSRSPTSAAPAGLTSGRGSIGARVDRA